jgi:quaternary ammonium compound-resistance protein SugE
MRPFDRDVVAAEMDISAASVDQAARRTFCAPCALPLHAKRRPRVNRADAVHRIDNDPCYGIRRHDESLGVPKMTAWLALAAAGLMEIVWVLGLKYSDGFTRLGPNLVTAVAIPLSFIFLGLSLKSVPFGIAYVVWAGIGAAGAVVAGMVLFEEPVDAVRIFYLALIVTGTVGLKLASP